MKKQGLSAREIARRIGKSPSFVYRVLRRKGLSGNGAAGKPKTNTRKTSRKTRSRRKATRAPAAAPA